MRKGVVVKCTVVTRVAALTLGLFAAPLAVDARQGEGSAGGPRAA